MNNKKKISSLNKLIINGYKFKSVVNVSTIISKSVIKFNEIR